MILGLIEAFFVSHTERGTLVREFLTLLLQPLIFLEVDGLFVLFRLEGDSVGRQRGFEFVDSNEACFFVLMEGVEPPLGFVNPSLKERLMAAAAAQHLFGLVFGPVGPDAQQVHGVHALSEMFRTGGLNGLFGRFIRVL